MSDAMKSKVPDLDGGVFKQALDLLECFVDEGDPCSFDHHGGCQSHGFLSLKPGEMCPHREALDLLRKVRGAE